MSQIPKCSDSQVMNFLHILRRFVFIFLAFLCWISWGVDLLASHFQESGTPNIQTYHPGSYINLNHFNSIVQGKDGFIYIGARNGILRYNSQSWKHIPAEGNIHLIRHLDNIIAYSKNQLFKIPPSLTNEFESPDSLFPSGEIKLSGNILQVLSHDENLYILTSTGLFLKGFNSLIKIKEESRILRIFPSGEGVIIQTEGNHYFTHDGEKLIILGLPGELDSLSDFIPHSDKVLYINESGSKLIIDIEGESPTPLLQPARFLSEFGYRSSTWLNNGELAIGTRQGGVVFANTKGQVTGRISMQNGLHNNEVIQVLKDHVNNLWVLHENAVSRVEIPSPFSFFRDANGPGGNTKNLLRHDGILYAASSHGLFRLHAATEPRLPSSLNAFFEKVDGINSECRCMESTPEGLLVGSSEGLFEVKGKKVRLVFPGEINCLKYLADQDVLLLGTDMGIKIFNLENWTEIKNFALPKISIDNIELSPGNFLWLSSRSGTLYRSNKPLSNPGNLVCESYRSDQLNAPPGSFTGLIRTSEKLFFSTVNGLLEFDPSSGLFFPDTILNLPLNSGTYRVSLIEEDEEKNQWMNIVHSGNTRQNIWFAEYAPGRGSAFHPLQYRQLNDRIINCMYAEENGILWIGTDQGALRYNYNTGYNSPAVAHAETTFHSYVSGVFSGRSGDKEIVRLNGIQRSEIPERLRIPFAKKQIRLEFFSTAYNCESSPLYRYSMTGLTEGWTEWTDNDFVEFNRLKTGKYEFRVQSQDIFGSIAESDTFHFRIKSPLLASWYALLFYFLLILVLLYFLQKWLNLQRIKGQFHLEEVVQERTESLIKEKDKAEDLLANILPKTTADELKAGGKATSSKFKMCSVLFADIQGFTKIAEEMNPDKLIDQLDRFYYKFDSVVEKYNIEKIKTIGDAYMAAGGIPIKNRTNPVDVVLAALEMQQFMKGLKESQSDIWDLRIGIHTGSVIAGVVGQKKYSYDIWGDTVNTASRMESSGEIGRVNISATTYKLIKDFFQCEFRGKMPVKYKGDIAMFFVNGLNPIFSESDKITPNAKFNIQIQLLRLLDLEEVILEKLKTELPEDLFFHNVEHTSHVYSQVELLGRGEQVSEEDLLLLQTAALLHDIGYIQGMEDHEDRSVEFAREILPLYRYSDEQVDQICKLIKATGMPPKPENLLEQIICDANLDHLGRVDFLIQSDKLFQEYRIKHKIRSKKDWNQYQINFLKSHEFYTKIANRMREVPKDQQIENIRQFS